MRNIKFRAWNKNTKKMYKIGQITLEKGTWNYEPDNREYVGMSIPYQPSFMLMQYTGLKDKNGKEIYEGDIIKCSFYPDFIFEIKFTELCWYMRKIPTSEHINLSDVLYEDLEVIGNIYDNKNLLEKGE